MAGRLDHRASVADQLRRGFSLLELILVLTVIVMAGAVVGPRLLPRVGESDLKSAALQFKADLAEIRAAAVESGVPMGCLVWHQRSEYVLGPASDLMAAASGPAGADQSVTHSATSMATAVPSTNDPSATGSARNSGNGPLTSAAQQPSGAGGATAAAGAMVPVARTVALPLGLALLPVVNAPNTAGMNTAGTNGAGTNGDIDRPGSDASSATASGRLNSGRSGMANGAYSSSSFQRGNPAVNGQLAAATSVQPRLPENGAAVAADWSLIVFQPSGRTHNLQLALLDNTSRKWIGLRLRGFTGGVTLSSVERLDPQIGGQRPSGADSDRQSSLSATADPGSTDSPRTW